MTMMKADCVYVYGCFFVFFISLSAAAENALEV